jgi:hypothetical protein
MPTSGLSSKPTSPTGYSHQNPAIADASAPQNKRRASTDLNPGDSPPAKRKNTVQDNHNRMAISYLVHSEEIAQRQALPHTAVSAAPDTEKNLTVEENQPEPVNPEPAAEVLGAHLTHRHNSNIQIERTPELTNLWVKFNRFSEAMGSSTNTKYACPPFIYAANDWAGKHSEQKADLDTALTHARQKFRAVFPQAIPSANTAPGLPDTNTLEFDYELLLAHLFLTASREINIENFSGAPAENFVATVALKMAEKYYLLPESKKKVPHKNKNQEPKNMSDEATKKNRQGVKIICSEYLTSITQLPLAKMATHPSIKTKSARENSKAKLRAENEVTPFTGKFCNIVKKHSIKGDNYTMYSFKNAINNATTSKPNSLNEIIDSFVEVHKASAEENVVVINAQSKKLAEAFRSIPSGAEKSGYGRVTFCKAEKVLSNAAMVAAVEAKQSELREAVQVQVSRSTGAVDQAAAATLPASSGEHLDAPNSHAA